MAHDQAGSGVRTSEGTNAPTSPTAPATEGRPASGKPAEHPQVPAEQGQPAQGTDDMDQTNQGTANLLAQIHRLLGPVDNDKVAGSDVDPLKSLHDKGKND